MNNVWKWIAGILASVIITMIGSYFTFGDVVPRSEVAAEHKEIRALIRENAKLINDLTVQVTEITGEVKSNKSNIERMSE